MADILELQKDLIEAVEGTADLIADDGSLVADIPMSERLELIDAVIDLGKEMKHAITAGERARLNALLAELGGGKKTRAKREPAKPKFRNPDTGETWSGRGRKPAWVRAAEDAGTLESMRILAG